jgi:hypothetical protein
MLSGIKRVLKLLNFKTLPAISAESVKIKKPRQELNPGHHVQIMLSGQTISH